MDASAILPETEAELTPEIIAAVDACYWSLAYKIQVLGGQFTLEDHEYAEEPMRSKHRIEVVMKATQLGFTEIEVLRTLHGLIHKKYPRGVLYLFPTRDDVQEFSKARFDPLIQANKTAIGKYVKSGGRGTDTASLKKVNEAYLYFRGATLTQRIGYGEVAESSKLRGIPVDKCVFDEYDLMDEEARQKALRRMGHSKIKEERYLSNPTIPDFGIDVLWQKSDKRYWHRKCQHCSQWTCAEREFPNCVKLGKDGQGFIACSKCGRPLRIGPGEWVADHRDRQIIGRRLSQLNSAFNDPYEILQEINDPPDGNLADVYRLRLGLPYIAAEDRLIVQQVLDCCGNDVMASQDAGPCAMGCDIGKTKHLIIGHRVGKDRYKILRVERFKEIDLGRLHYLCKVFNVRSGVIDIRPYEDEVRSFQKQERFKIYLCEYAENMLQAVQYDDKRGTVRVNRTEIFDATHRITVTKRLELPRSEMPEVKEFAKQMCATAKVLETNKRTNSQIYRYKKLGDEHYRNALNYFYLAAQGSRIATVGDAIERPTQTDNNYARI